MSSIPDEFHWFCDLTEFDEGAEPECVLSTSERIEKAQTLLKLFATIDNGSSLPWVKDQLIKQLSRCAVCVKTFHEKKREMFIDMQRFASLLKVFSYYHA